MHWEWKTDEPIILHWWLLLSMCLWCLSITWLWQLSIKLQTTGDVSGPIILYWWLLFRLCMHQGNIKWNWQRYMYILYFLLKKFKVKRACKNFFFKIVMDDHAESDPLVYLRDAHYPSILIAINLGECIFFASNNDSFCLKLLLIPDMQEIITDKCMFVFQYYTYVCVSISI